ncbi:hypothetical protein HJFPF1_00190 [Paramyrothecium foliicola]|nr:hypothetical protein HJFPF1_00190 [Paramyrothecium foliicola]
MRTFVKLKYVRRFYLEDLTCTIAWALIILYTATVFVMIHYGEGYHSWEISKHDYSQMLKWLYASSVVYLPAAFFTKATLLLLIARVFAIRESASRAIHGFIIFILIAYIPLQGIKIAICNPIRSYWRADIPGKCFNQRKIFLADLAVGILTDLAILIIPIPLTWRLNVSKWRKFKIMVVLGAGGVATAMSILRLVVAIDFMKSKDVAADFVILDLLTIIEIAIGLICSCLPSLNVFIDRLFRRRRRTPNHLPQRRISGPKKTIDSLNSYWRSFGTTFTRTDEPPNRPLAEDVREEAAMEDVQTGEVEPRRVEAGDVETADTRTSEQNGRLALTHANSDEGRRDGWLDMRTQQKSSMGERTEPQMRRVSMELANQRGTQPWDRVWDGNRVSPSYNQPMSLNSAL